jgi:hypothetical protein
VSDLSGIGDSVLTRRDVLGRAVAAAAVAGFGVVRVGTATAAAWPGASAYDPEVPAAWFDVALQLVRTTPGFSPPVASRAFGYTGVALYEGVAPGLPDKSSLAGRVNGLTAARLPADAAYHWPTVANSALAAILRNLFPTASAANVTAVDDLERRFADQAKAMLPLGIYKRSVDRGSAVADHVFKWSMSDGGHEAFRNNFPAYAPPQGPGLWVPTPRAFQPALQPYWGENRTFVLASGDSCAAPAPLPYSETPGSAFFVEMLECYDTVNNLSPEQTAIAQFWSDDPGLTATPPGHSISILTQVMRRPDLRIRLDRAAEAYAKVGMAVADAFISCWKTKFRYNVIRPVTCIRSLVDPAWLPLLNTPPFPEYTSGHSIQSGAAAQVLTDLFGVVAFTDHTHDNRGLAPRSFDSFVQASEEAAISRLYGGIHFRHAIERGLDQGRCIGQMVSAVV